MRDGESEGGRERRMEGKGGKERGGERREGGGRRKGERKGGKERGGKGGKEKEREREREGGRKRGREEEREGGREGGRKRGREKEREGKNLLHFLVSFLSLPSSHLLPGLVPAELGTHNVHNPRQSFICCLNVQKGQPGPPGQHIDSSACVLANGILHFGFNVGEHL